MTSETRRRATKRHAATANDRTTSDCSSEPKSRVWPRNQPQLAPPSATSTPNEMLPTFAIDNVDDVERGLSPLDGIIATAPLHSRRSRPHAMPGPRFDGARESIER